MQEIVSYGFLIPTPGPSLCIGRGVLKAYLFSPSLYKGRGWGMGIKNPTLHDPKLLTIRIYSEKKNANFKNAL